MKLRIIITDYFLPIAKLLLIVAVVIVYIRYSFPQKWTFFLVKPRAPILNIYRIENGTINNKPIIQNNVSYGLGISRQGRFMYNELLRLTNENKNLEWNIYYPDSVGGLIKRGKYILISVSNRNFFKGKFLITKKDLTSYPSIDTLKLIPPKQFAVIEIR